MDNLYPVRLLKDHAYALIDRVAVTDAPHDWPVIPLVPQGLEKEAHLLPALLLCTEMSETQQMQLLELFEQSHIQDQQLPVVTFLHSDMDKNRLQIHWMKQLLIRLPQGGNALLRSYDPRVFIQLQWILQPEKIKELFGPVTRWTIYQDGNWRSFHPPEVDNLIHTKLNVKQVDQLVRIGCINQVFDKLPDANRRDRIAIGRSIDALLSRAQEHNFKQEAEQITFALHGMTIHSDFDKHPRVKRMIDEIDPEEQTYCDAAALLDETVWQEIANDLNNSSTKPKTS